MAAAMAVPLLVSALLSVCGSWLGRRMPPATAVRLLTTAMFVTGLAVWFGLAVMGLLVLAQIPLFAAVGHYSGRVIVAGLPVPLAVAALAPLLLCGLIGAALRRAVLGGWDLTRAAVACRRLGPAAAGLVVVDHDQPDAYALPGIPGRVVVSTAMLRALPADERRVLLAHEAAHLSKRHFLWLQAAEIAAAANPLAGPAVRAVRTALERWADEVAAAEVGDRTLAARTLARAALARAAARPEPAMAAGLFAANSDVADRTRALLAGPSPRRPVLTGAIAALMLTTVTATAVTTVATAARFEAAYTAHPAGL